MLIPYYWLLILFMVNFVLSQQKSASRDKNLICNIYVGNNRIHFKELDSRISPGNKFNRNQGSAEISSGFFSAWPEPALRLPGGAEKKCSLRQNGSQRMWDAGKFSITAWAPGLKYLMLASPSLFVQFVNAPQALCQQCIKTIFKICHCQLLARSLLIKIRGRMRRAGGGWLT